MSPRRKHAPPQQPAQQAGQDHAQHHADQQIHQLTDGDRLVVDRGDFENPERGELLFRDAAPILGITRLQSGLQLVQKPGRPALIDFQLHQVRFAHIAKFLPLRALKVAPSLDGRVVVVAQPLKQLGLLQARRLDVLLQRSLVVVDFVDQIAQAFVPFRDLHRLGRAVFRFISAIPIMMKSLDVIDSLIQQRNLHLLRVARYAPRFVRQVDR